MKAFILLLSTMLLWGCSDSDSSYLQSSEKFYQLSEQEQTLYAPTNLFKAIYINDSRMFNEEFAASYVDFAKKNFEGDTALAVAIKLQRVDFVKPLVSKATIEDLRVPNKDNRSFVSLLAEYNFEEAFDIIGLKFIQNTGALQSLVTSFKDIDFPDSQDMIAAHYTQTASFLDKLEGYWFYGLADFTHPWDGFYHQRDLHGDTFLHKASEFNKTEIVSWFVRRHCGVWGAEENDWPIIGGIIRGVSYGARSSTEFLGEQKYVPLRRSYINFENNDGNTPLHLAAKNGNDQIIELLLQCRQINPLVQNGKNQPAISVLLSSIDPEQTEVEESYKRSFNFLVNQIGEYWVFFYTFRDLISEKDNNGLSASHYAARLRDPYFYRILEKDIGPTADEQGVIPQDRKK